MAYHVSSFRVDFADDVDKSHDRSGSNPPPPPLGRPPWRRSRSPARLGVPEERKQETSVDAGRRRDSKKEVGTDAAGLFQGSGSVYFFSSSHPLYQRHLYSSVCMMIAPLALSAVGLMANNGGSGTQATVLPATNGQPATRKNNSLLGADSSTFFPLPLTEGRRTR